MRGIQRISYSHALFVNWACLVIMFIGLVMLSKSIEHIRVTETEHEEINQREIAELVAIKEAQAQIVARSDLHFRLIQDMHDQSEARDRALAKLIGQLEVAKR